MDHKSVHAGGDSKDGALLFASLLKDTNINKGGLTSSAIPDTLATQTVALELLPKNETRPVDAAIPDSLATQTAVLELLPKDDVRPVDAAIPDSLATQTASLELLPKDDVRPVDAAIPDSLATQTAALELLPKDDVPSVDAAIPDSLATQTAALELSPTPKIDVGPVDAAIPDSLATQTAALELHDNDRNKNPYGDILRLHGVAEDYAPDMASHQLMFWQENGYLAIPGALSQETLSKLMRITRETADKLIKGGEDVVVHTGYNEKKEQSYVSPCGRLMAGVDRETFGDTTKTPLQRISRLGCGVHRVLPDFRSVTFSTFHNRIAHELGLLDPRITQSQIVTKAPDVGPKIVPHQDGCTVFTDPPSCVTFWYALEDCTVDNGCLAVAPGSHREEPLRRRCKKDALGRAVFEDLEVPVWARFDGVDDTKKAKRGEDGEYVWKELEVKAGTLVLMHGNLMHKSEANKSEKSRTAYVFGVLEGGLEWKADNYLQPYDGEKEFEKLGPLI